MATVATTTTSAAIPGQAAVAETKEVAASMNDEPEAEVKPSTPKKDIRKHPKYSFLYEVRRYNTLYHVSVVRAQLIGGFPHLLRFDRSSSVSALKSPKTLLS